MDLYCTSASSLPLHICWTCLIHRISYFSHLQSCDKLLASASSEQSDPACRAVGSAELPANYRPAWAVSGLFFASVDNCNMNNLEATNVLCNTWMVCINKPFRIEDWLIIGSLPQKKQTWQQLLQHHRPFSVSTQQRSNKTLKPATGMSYPSGPLHTKWGYMKTNWDSCYPWKLSIHPSISVECDAGGEAQKSISHNPPSTSIS